MVDGTDKSMHAMNTSVNMDSRWNEASREEEQEVATGRDMVDGADESLYVMDMSINMDGTEDEEDHRWTEAMVP